jgi:hypothetical protein
MRKIPFIRTGKGGGRLLFDVVDLENWLISKKIEMRK